MSEHGELRLAITEPLEAPMPGDANVKRHGDPLALDIWCSGVASRMVVIRRSFAQSAAAQAPGRAV